MIPDGIAALAQKIGVDNDTNIRESLDDVDPTSLVNSMGVFGGESDDGFMFQEPNVQEQTAQWNVSTMERAKEMHNALIFKV